MFRKIMVAYDESPEAGKALQAAIKLAKALQAELSVVTVIEPLPACYSFAITPLSAIEWRKNKQTQYMSLQTQARQQAEAAGVWLDMELVNGDEVSSIIECAQRHRSDLLVLGMRKHRLRIGQTAKDIAKRSPCALLGIR